MTDLAPHRPDIERVLAATRYFQATALTAMLIYISLIATFYFVLEPEALESMANFWWQTMLSKPETNGGMAMKIGTLMPVFFPLLSLLAAGALSNAESPVAIIIGAGMLAIVGFMIQAAAELSSIMHMVPKGFFYIYVVAAPINFTVLGLMLVSVLTILRLPKDIRDNLRDGFGFKPFRTVILRVIGLPIFTLHLRLRRIIVIPLFVLSSVLLASSLYPFLFANAMAGNLYRINRAECILQGARRFDCLQNAMLRDALLFPIYVGLGFGLSYGLYLIFRTAARKSAITSMQALLKTDKRRPVLFLRPFEDDQVLFHKPRRRSIFRFIRIGEEPKFFEHQVLEEMTEIGPVVAIGNRGRKGVPFGAARDFLPDDVWRDRVMGLIGSSRVIVVVLNETPGVWWEIQAILSQGAVEKTLFVFPWGSMTKTARLRDGLLQCMEANGIARPVLAMNERRIVGVYRKDGAWVLVETDAPESIDTLAMLRMFGHAALRQVPLSETSAKRYPFSIAMLGLIGAMIFADDIARSVQHPAEIAAPLPEGWSSEPVVGLDSGQTLNGQGYVEAARPHGSGSGIIAAVRRVTRSPDLVWFDEAGVVQRLVRISVPERERSSHRLPAVIPFALDQTEDMRIRVGLTIAGDDWHRHELREYSDRGALLSRIELKGPFDLGRGAEGRFVEGGLLVINRTFVPEDDDTFAYLGGFQPDGRWETLSRFRNGRPQLSDVLSAPGGELAVGGQLGKKWFFIVLNADGQLTTWADPPRDPGFGSASVLATTAEAGWFVAGRQSDSDDPDAPDWLTIAALSNDGTYTWVKVIEELEGFFPKSLHLRGDRIYLTATDVGLYDQRTFILVLSTQGELLETVQIPSGGERSLRVATMTEDGEIWLLGTARDIPPGTAPLERSELKSMPWIERVRPRAPQ